MAEDKTICAEAMGIPFTVERAALNDIEVLEMLGDVQGDVTVLPRLMRAVFGGEQYENVKASLRRDGRTSSTDMAAFFSEAFAAAGEQAKNS